MLAEGIRKNMKTERWEKEPKNKKEELEWDYCVLTISINTVVLSYRKVNGGDLVLNIPHIQECS